MAAAVAALVVMAATLFAAPAAAQDSSSNDATLSSLTLTPGHANLRPAFASDTTTYTGLVGYDTEQMTVTPVTTDTNAGFSMSVLAVDSNTVTLYTGATPDIALNPGENRITVVVTAANGDEAPYTVTVTRLPQSDTDFVTTWEIPNNSRRINIPVSGSSLDYTVDWGDGRATSHTGGAAHTYATGDPTEYEVRISGNNFPKFSLDGNGRDQIRSVDQWGNQVWTSMHSTFLGVTDFEIKAADSPILGTNTWTYRMFWEAEAFTGAETNMGEDRGAGDKGWNVSKVINMSEMFKKAKVFNQNLSGWKVQKVTNFQAMFEEAVAFDQNIGGWNVRRATNMKDMFKGATKFGFSASDTNSEWDLSRWKVHNVSRFDGMFEDATNFNQSLGAWDISSATNMTSMLDGSDIDTDNYNDTLIGWSTLDTTKTPPETLIPTGITLGAAGRTYSSAAAQVARAKLEVTHSWVITGDRLVDGTDIRLDGLTLMTVDEDRESVTLALDQAVGLPTTEYSATVGSTVGSGDSPLTVTPSTINPNTTVSVNDGTFKVSGIGVGVVVPLNDAGETTTITIMVRGEDYDADDDTKLYTQAYTLTITREASPDVTPNNAPTKDNDITRRTAIAGVPFRFAFPENTFSDADGDTLSYGATLSDGTALPDWLEFMHDPSHATNPVSRTFRNKVGMLPPAPVSSDTPTELTVTASDDLGGSVTADFELTVITKELAAFITVWEVTDADKGIVIPTGSSGETHDYNVNWGDGTVTTGITDYTTDPDHTYIAAGRYAVTITGEFPGISMSRNSVAAGKLREVSQWGGTGRTWSTMQAAFKGVNGEFEITADDVPTLADGAYMIDMFAGTATCTGAGDALTCTGFTGVGSRIGDWDVSGVTAMDRMFKNAAVFNADISGWGSKVSNVGGMQDMFNGARAFDRDLGRWDISSVGGMGGMLTNSGLSTENYDKTLIGWSKQTSINPNVYLSANGLKYSSAHRLEDSGNAQLARAILDVTHSWTFEGDGLLDGTDIRLSGLTLTEDRKSVTLDQEAVALPTVKYSATVASDADGFEVTVTTRDAAATVTMSTDTPGVTVTTEGVVTLPDPSTEDLEIEIDILVKGEDYADTDTERYTQEYTLTITRSAAGNLAPTRDNPIADRTAVAGLPFRFAFPANTFSDANGNTLSYTATLSDGTALPDWLDFDSGTRTFHNKVDMSMRPPAPVSPSTSTVYNITVTASDDGDSDTSDDASDTFVLTVIPRDPAAFITDWVITDADKSIIIPTVPAGGTYDYDVNWGDGTVTEDVTGHAERPHDPDDPDDGYTAAGRYTVTITGDFKQIRIGDRADAREKILSVRQWGAGREWASMERAFQGVTTNFQISEFDDDDLTLDLPNLANVTKTEKMFHNARQFTGVGSRIGEWVVSNVRDMDGMFHNAIAFNQDLGDWDVSSVDRMYEMFRGAAAFNQDLGDWDISNSPPMDYMFTGTGLSTENYDKALNGWSTLTAGERRIPLGTYLSATEINYSGTGQLSHEILDTTRGWRFFDAGLLDGTGISLDGLTLKDHMAAAVDLDQSQDVSQRFPLPTVGYRVTMPRWRATAYSATVEGDVTEVTVTPSTTDADATVSVNDGDFNSSDTGVVVPLNDACETTLITIMVRGEDYDADDDTKLYTQAYTLIIDRPALPGSEDSSAECPALTLNAEPAGAITGAEPDEVITVIFQLERGTFEDAGDNWRKRLVLEAMCDPDFELRDGDGNTVASSTSYHPTQTDERALDEWRDDCEYIRTGDTIMTPLARTSHSDTTDWIPPEGEGTWVKGPITWAATLTLPDYFSGDWTLSASMDPNEAWSGTTPLVSWVFTEDDLEISDSPGATSQSAPETPEEDTPEQQDTQHASCAGDNPHGDCPTLTISSDAQTSAAAGDDVIVTLSLARGAKGGRQPWKRLTLETMCDPDFELRDGDGNVVASSVSFHPPQEEEWAFAEWRGDCRYVRTGGAIMMPPTRDDASFDMTDRNPGAPGTQVTGPVNWTATLSLPDDFSGEWTLSASIDPREDASGNRFTSLVVANQGLAISAPAPAPAPVSVEQVESDTPHNSCAGQNPHGDCPTLTVSGAAVASPGEELTVTFSLARGAKGGNQPWKRLTLETMCDPDYELRDENGNVIASSESFHLVQTEERAFEGWRGDCKYYRTGAAIMTPPQRDDSSFDMTDRNPGAAGTQVLGPVTWTSTLTLPEDFSGEWTLSASIDPRLDASGNQFTSLAAANQDLEISAPARAPASVEKVEPDTQHNSCVGDNPNNKCPILTLSGGAGAEAGDEITVTFSLARGSVSGGQWWKRLTLETMCDPDFELRDENGNVIASSKSFHLVQTEERARTGWRENCQYTHSGDSVMTPQRAASFDSAADRNPGAAGTQVLGPVTWTSTLTLPDGYSGAWTLSASIDPRLDTSGNQFTSLAAANQDLEISD